MGMNNIELYNLAKKYLGTKGADARSYCGLPSGSAWCCAFVTWIFYKGDDKSLFYGGSKVVYCPTAINWCKANLAQIPIYLSLPMDIIFFDWQPNGVPDHIGFVKERKSDQEVYTIEGNTSGGIVAEKTRPDKYVCGCFRPAFKATWKDAPLTVDGYFGYNSVAMLQKALKAKGVYSDTIDGILGKNTVKGIQKLCNVAQDGSWGKNTTRAMQKYLGVTVDGAWGITSTKALQTWINKVNGAQPAPTPQPTPKPEPTPTPNGKLVIDGHGGTATVKAMQRFFGTTQDGVISGQNKDLKRYYPSLEAVNFGSGGSACIKNLQRWVGANQDGIIGQITVKLWQKKIGVAQDGIFGVNSMKTWQKYLNEHDKAVYPSKTNGQKIGEKANELAYASAPAEAKYPSGHAKAAYKTALEKVYPNRSSWGSAPRVGASCDVFVGTVVRASGVDANFPRGLEDQWAYLKKSSKFTNVVNITSRNLKESELKDGDIVTYNYKKDGGHILIWYGGKLKHASIKEWYGRTTTEGGRFKISDKKWIRVYRAK